MVFLGADRGLPQQRGDFQQTLSKLRSFRIFVKSGIFMVSGDHWRFAEVFRLPRKVAGPTKARAHAFSGLMDHPLPLAG